MTNTKMLYRKSDKQEIYTKGVAPKKVEVGGVVWDWVVVDSSNDAEVQQAKSDGWQDSPFEAAKPKAEEKPARNALSDWAPIKKKRGRPKKESSEATDG